MDSASDRLTPGQVLRSGVGLVAAAVLLLCWHIAMRLGLHTAGAGLLLGAGACAVGGVAHLAFQLATRRSFEWLIAWRYLRVQHRRSWGAFFTGLGLVLVAAAVLVASYVVGQPQLEGLELVGPTTLQRILRMVSLGMFTLAHWVLFFGVLMLFFSLFTTISIFTVFLGIEALVAVLSMMGGFENDLRQKILGATAHVVISKERAVFTEYREVLSGISRIKHVVAASPHLESEVMITSQTNLSGALLRGIDPRRMTKVTDLERFLQNEGASGRLDNLLHPEKLAKMPEFKFRPMVTKPMGGKEGGDKPGGEGGALGDGAPGDEGSGGGQGTAGGSGARGGEEPGEGRRRPGVISTEMWDVDEEVGKKVPPRPVYPGIIIGAELAKTLRVYVGDDVNVVAPLGGMSPAGPIPKSKPFRIAGIFYSGLYEYDNKFVYTTIPAAQRFLGFGDEITGIEIKVDALEHATPVAEAARTRLGEQFKVEDWKQRNVNLFSALKLEKLVMFIVLTFIILVASFSIVTNLNMVVLEKVREIAALKAMGARDWSVLKVFLYAGLYIGIIGMLVGLLGGLAICTVLGQGVLPLDPEIYYISELPVRVNPADIAIVAVSGVLISFLATIYPSILAARLRPADGMRRHEA